MAASRARSALFRAPGYRPIADYNGNPYAEYWFEKRLTGSSRGQ